MLLVFFSSKKNINFFFLVDNLLEVNLSYIYVFNLSFFFLLRSVSQYAFIFKRVNSYFRLNKY